MQELIINIKSEKSAIDLEESAEVRALLNEYVIPDFFKELFAKADIKHEFYEREYS